MSGSVQPSGPDKPYHSQYRDTPAFHAMWNKLFRREISNDESAKMTDNYMRMVNDFMNTLAQNAIQNLKKTRKLIESDYQDDGS